MFFSCIICHLNVSILCKNIGINKFRIEKIAKIRDNRKRKQFICKEDYIMENCIFCKIANGEIPSATLYEDEDFRVILDLGPASK